ncbi:PAQR2 protein, partial [Amia calva]|nr:PAQR2 protein [Amia calva]
MGMTPLLQAHHAMERMEEFVHKVWEGRWRVIPHDVLPDWLKDNDYLLHGHRPPMPSFRACFKSIFRIHTETGNIWTHLLGCLFFICLGIVYMFRPNMTFVAPFQEKIVIGMFFLGAILCLSFSWVFHTVYCHSEGVSRVFSKLDYSGIAFLIMGSFVPWLYYSFYCSPQPCFIYLFVICVLGISAIVVSQWDRFATPQYRGVRAGVFVGLGLSGVVPTLHFVISEGFFRATTIGQMGWLFLMAVLYITGACLYAARIPERFFPGKCDIWTLKMTILPKFSYLFQCIPICIPKLFFIKLNQVISSFIWNKKSPHIQRVFLQRPEVMGGMVLPEQPQSQETTPVWLQIEVNSCKFSSLLALLCVSLPTPISNYSQNPIVRHTLKIWTQFRTHFGLMSLSVLSPIDSNHLFPPSLVDQAFHVWHRNGITTIQDLYKDRILMSFEQLANKFNLPQSHFSQYLQVRHKLLHWLLIPARIQFKTTKSASSPLPFLQSHSFSSLAPKWWNDLPNRSP